MSSEGTSTRKLPTFTQWKQTGEDEIEQVEIGPCGGARDPDAGLLTFGGPVFQKEHRIAVK